MLVVKRVIRPRSMPLAQRDGAGCCLTVDATGAIAGSNTIANDQLAPI